MQSKKANPFDECPVYETEHFIYSFIDENDAEDLFACYSDPVTLSHMNNDNCSGEFRCASIDVMKDAIRCWQEEYERRTFIRWSIKDKDTGKGIGTIEIAPLPWGKWFFGKETPIGILRIDLLSVYEQEANFVEIIRLLASELANDFEVSQVIMKAPPDELSKVNALATNQFQPYGKGAFRFEHYFVKTITSL